MKKIIKIVAALMLGVALLLPLASQASAQVSTEQAYKSAANYMLKLVQQPTYGDEWVIIALARGGATVPAGYYDTYYQNLTHAVQQKQGNLHQYKYTEYARVVLALSAIGKDATNVGGYNLVKKLEQIDKVVWQGLNGPIFALIALDSWHYDSAVGEAYLNEVVTNQLEDGGFALSGDRADLDMTAMAIQALAPYKDREQVAKVIERALHYIEQHTTYNSSESAAQVVTALSSLGMDAKQHVKHLLDFYSTTDGGFKHVQQETTANGMATEQTSYALAAYTRFLTNKATLYNMQETKSRFRDTAMHWAKDYIEQAASFGFINGFEDNTFRPNAYLTRAQAAAILVRALKLTNEQAAPYQDLGNMSIALKNEIAAAYEAGIIQANTSFYPNQNVTRIQFALMLLRTYNKQHDVYTTQAFPSHHDTKHLNEEAQLALAFLAQHRIAQGSNGNFYPNEPTTRAEATKMLINFLNVME